MAAAPQLPRPAQALRIFLWLRKVSLIKPQPLPKITTGLQSPAQGKANNPSTQDPGFRGTAHFGKEEVRYQCLVSPQRQGKHKSPLLSPELLVWDCSLFAPPVNANCSVLQSFLHWGYAQGKETLSALINNTADYRTPIYTPR